MRLPILALLLCLTALGQRIAQGTSETTSPSQIESQKQPEKSNTAASQSGAAKSTDLLVSPPPNLPMDPAAYSQQPVPILIAPPPPSPPVPNTPGAIRPLSFQSASEIIKVIVGLAVLFALAYLAGISRVQALERKLQVSSVVTAGLPFVFLGVFAHSRGVGILSESVLWELRPLLALGLGWIGFSTGFRFDSKLGESIIPGTSVVSLITASVPFATIVAAVSLLLVFVEHTANAIFLRDAMLLGTAGAMTAYVPRFLETRGPAGRELDRVYSIVTLEQLAGFLGLLIVAAYFRPQDDSVAWRLPGTAWLFITLGMGTMIGGVVWGMLAKIKAGPEFTVLILGSICFTSGMASFLRISPLVVCFIVGLILVNLPGTSKQQIRDVLEHMEHPIYLLFLLVAGSLWSLGEWQGWALMLLFVPARLAGKWLAVEACTKRAAADLSPEEKRSLVFSPMGALSIAIVVNAQDLYFGPTVSWMVTAVIGGAILTEIIVQIASRRGRLDEPALSGAV